MRQQYARRTQLVMLVISLISLAIILQIVRIQNSPEAAIFDERALDYQYEWRTFYPDRGEIYDRTGHLLAGNKSVYEIGVDLNTVKDANAIAGAVSVELGMEYSQVLDSIQNPPEGLSYIVIADFVELQKALRLKDLKVKLQEDAEEGTLGGLTGLEFKSHPQRSYPESSLASNILGFVNREGRGLSLIHISEPTRPY